ncbi:MULTISPECIES: hypothetical protein [unclassified Curtobacterium]|uniref:hypothetical protein n=1 Tax=unclassified Curtobacterium TaxID=257496 RepID=UPI00285E4124|nr:MULTISPECIES: hypothetical protein [unclassified Curtobacterium]MDR6169899.1 hypothetical protein [Curtobacterium sp. SORGH_AS_0776]MDR6573236.1 hypothetical protein [Curtobacterium sp. 320]
MTVTTAPAAPAVPAVPAGEYVNRSLVVSGVGTFTGVPATARGTYVSGTTSRARTGQYVQASPRRVHRQTLMLTNH